MTTKTHSRLLPRILHGLEVIEAGALWEGVDGELQKVMLSSGGPRNGALWIMPTRSARDLLPDAHFMMAPIGFVSNITGRRGALLKYRDDPESQCEQPMNSRLHHMLTCKAGLAHKRQHRAVVEAFADRLRQSGAQVDKETPSAGHVRVCDQREGNENGEGSDLRCGGELSGPIMHTLG